MTDAPQTDPARIAAIQAREQAATKGPWETKLYGPYQRVRHIYGQRTPPTVATLERAAVAIDAPYVDEVVQADLDAEFIAHAREDVPYLLAELTRLHAEMANMADTFRQSAQGLSDKLSATQVDVARLHAENAMLRKGALRLHHGTPDNRPA